MNLCFEPINAEQYCKLREAGKAQLITLTESENLCVVEIVSTIFKNRVFCITDSAALNAVGGRPVFPSTAETGGPMIPCIAPSDFPELTVEQVDRFLHQRGWSQVDGVFGCWKKPGVSFLAGRREAFLLEL